MPQHFLTIQIGSISVFFYFDLRSFKVQIELNWLLLKPESFALSTEEDFEKLPHSTIPEMQRSNLAPVILQLKALGIDNVLRFPFLSVSAGSFNISWSMINLSTVWTAF